MRNRFARPRLAIALAILVGGVHAWSGAARAGDQPDFQRIISERAPALVTVKFLIKISMPGRQGEESPSESAGVMIDPKGLVLCSNTQMGGIAGTMMRMMGRDSGDISAVPSDLKVLVGDDAEGIEAKLVARDSDLDLAWVQIKDPGDKKFAFIDFSKAATPNVGDPLIMLKRMGKYFDRVPTFGEVRLAGVVKKPRDLFIPSLNIGTYGAPVLTGSGEITGITVLQMPESDDSGEGMMNMMMSMSNAQESMAAFILPADDVVKATKRALEGGGDKKEDGKKEPETKEPEKKEIETDQVK